MRNDLLSRLRDYSSNPGYSHNDYADTMREAAGEIKRLQSRVAELEGAMKAQDIMIEQQMQRVGIHAIYGCDNVEIMADRIDELERATDLAILINNDHVAEIECLEAAQAGIARAALERAAQKAERCYVKDAFRFELGKEAAAAIRSLDPASIVPAQRSGWISVKDDIPDSGAHLTFEITGDFDIMTANAIYENQHYVTHYMPLPPAPTQEKEK